MERVNTGGLTEIRYEKGYKPRAISPEEEERMDRAWAKIRARRRKQKIITWIIILVILVALGIYFLASGF